MPLTAKGEEIKRNMEKQYGPEKGERVFYASKNAGTITGVDGVPVGDCYGRTDQGWPPMDPTTQPNGMYEPSDAEQTPAKRERLRGELHYGKALHEGRITGKEHQGFIEAVHKNAAEKDAAPQPGEPGHEARELAVAHELEAMHNPASTFEDALFGGGRAHDYSRDASGLPQTVTHRQMQNFAASVNFGEGVTK